MVDPPANLLTGINGFVYPHIMTRYLYIIGSETGPKKVGITNNLTTRLRQIQTGNADRLSVLKSWELGEAAPLVEKAVHSRLARYRQAGEWFDADQSLIESAIEEIINPHTIDGELELLIEEKKQQYWDAMNAFLSVGMEIRSLQAEMDKRKALSFELLKEIGKKTDELHRLGYDTGILGRPNVE